MSAQSPWGPPLVALLVLLAVPLVGSGPTGLPSEAAQATPGPPPPVGFLPLDGGVHPPGHRAYVTQYSGNNVPVIDTTPNTVVGAPIPVGSHPFGVGMDPTVHRAYVANQGSNTVSVIDTTTN